MELPFNDKDLTPENALKWTQELLDEQSKIPLTAKEIENNTKFDKRIKNFSPDVIVTLLKEAGFSFRLNEMDDSIEVNGERITDTLRSVMYTHLRRLGCTVSLSNVEHYWVEEANKNKYHPIKEYGKGLKWDGGKYIESMCDCFEDTPFTDSKGISHRLLPILMRKWMIGCWRRVYTGQQNGVLTFVGKQGIGKSTFVEWLCPLPNFHIANGINPDNKDHSLLAITKFIWEVSELGSTTRRSDVDGLKEFTSKRHFDVRPPYGRNSINKPALANFIGTANPDNKCGILHDTTGNRRFWVVPVNSIDYGYVEYDKNMLWAEAHDAYMNNESCDLTVEEKEMIDTMNKDFEAPNAMEDYIKYYFNLYTKEQSDGISILPKELPFMSSVEVLEVIKPHYRESSERKLFGEISDTLEKLGIKEKRLGGGGPRGYLGIEKKDMDND